MIDHRCVPDLLHGLYFLGRVIRVLYLKGGFDFEGVERARSGRDAFLRDHLRGARALPAKSGRAVEIGGFERPGFAHRQRWSNAAAVIGRIPPDAVGHQIPGKIEGLPALELPSCAIRVLTSEAETSVTVLVMVDLTSPVMSSRSS